MSQVYTSTSFSPPWIPGPGEVRDSADSTNSLLKNPGRGVGEWVLAMEQTQGRGRSDHTWVSPRGGLYMSVKVPLCPRVLAWSLAMAAASVEEIRTRGFQASLKWPNDIERDGLKLGGILGEVVEGGVVLGLGLNVAEGPWPKGSGFLGGSCSEVDLLELARGILVRLAAISQGSEEALESLWQGLWHGRTSDFVEGAQAVSGRISNVSLRHDEVTLIGDGAVKKVRASLLRELWPSLQ